MTTQEEFRREAYERWVGETGNNSMGTMANQQGYENYEARQKADRQFYSDIQSSLSTTPKSFTNYTPLSRQVIPNSNGYISSASNYTYSTSSGGWFSFIDDFIETIPPRVYWILAFIGTVLAYGYVSYSIGSLIIESQESFFNYYIGPIIFGFIVGLFFIHLLALAAKLVIIAFILGVFAGVLYLLYLLYENWP